MSKVIEFNTRDYKFDPTCTSNVGDRVTISTDFGIKEVWDIGSWQCDWSQIYCEKKLEKDTDYILRFAVVGGICGTWDSVTNVCICHTDGFNDLNEAWEDKMTFPLDNDRFAPIISKRNGDGNLLRVFEIPFSTGDFEDWKIMFIAMRAKTIYMSAEKNEAYAGLENLTISDLKAMENNEDAVSENNEKKLDLSGAVINEKMLEKFMELAKLGYDINLSGAVVESCD